MKHRTLDDQEARLRQVAPSERGQEHFLLYGEMDERVAGLENGHVGSVQDPDFRIGQFPGDVTARVDVGLDGVHVALDDAHAGRQPVEIGLAETSPQLTKTTLVVEVVACGCRKIVNTKG